MDNVLIEANRKQLLIYQSETEIKLAIKEHYIDYGHKPVFMSLEQAAHISYKSLQNRKNKIFVRHDMEIMSPANLSPCAIGIGLVVADVLGFAFSLLGIGDDVINSATNIILGELSEGKLLSLIADLHNIANTNEPYEQSVQAVNLFFAVTSVLGGISAIISAIKSSMSWYDWIFMAASIIAQLTLWFGTDGAALIAELCLEGTVLARIAIDTASAVNTCVS